jgi:cell shape-determining protein MreC
MISLQGPTTESTSLGSIQRQRKLLFTFLFYGSVCVILWLFEFVGLGRVLRNVSQFVVTPVMQVVTAGVQVVETPYYVARSSLRATRRIQDLEIKYSQSLAEVSRLQALEEENRALRDLLEGSDRKLVRSVITRPIVSYAQPTIAVGSVEGIEPASVVLIGNTLVGLVDEVREHSSSIDLLFQSPNSNIVAKTEAGVEGIIVGNGRQIIMTEVERDAEVLEGQRVVTVGQPGIRPDLFLGQVVEIHNDPSAPVKEVVIEQLVDFYQVRVVEVMQ